MVFGGTSFVTIAPAAITAFSPTVTPCKIVALIPIHTPSLITIGLAIVALLFARFKS